jgi:hypothetical protein
MAAVNQSSGAGNAAPPGDQGARLYDRADYTLSQLLCAWPGGSQSNGDTKMPVDLTYFDRLSDKSNPAQVASLVAWVEPHTTVAALLRSNGPDGCKRVLRGIAQAAVKLGVPMKSRTRHTAEALGLIP